MVPRKGTIFLILCIGIYPCSFPDSYPVDTFLDYALCIRKSAGYKVYKLRIEEKNTIQCMLILNA